MTPDDRPAGQRNGHKTTTTRVSNGLVALGSASVFAIYALGFARTKAASERFSDDATPRRRPAPVPSEAPAPTMSLPPLAETASPASGVQSRAAEATPAPWAPPAAAPALARDQPAVPAAREPMVTPGAKATASATSGEAATPTSSMTPAATAPAPTAAATSATAVTASAAETPAAPAPAAATTATPAPAALAAAATATVAAPAKVILKDGSYTGWGTCRHGDIQATVVIAAGRIQSATISQCWTRYPCSWISPLPPQVVQRQSAEVDYVTGATQSTNAFYDAVMDALAKAK